MNQSGATTLTKNAIQTMYQMDSSVDNEFFLPIVQVLRLKKLDDGVKWAVSGLDCPNFH